MIRLAATAATVCAAAFLGALWYVSRPSGDDMFASCRASAIAGGAGSIGGPFELVNTDGQTVTDKDVITGPTLVYFGYTFCPDVCPLDTVRNAEAVDLMEQDGHQVTPVFISVDPKRDTPEVVADFVHNVDARMIGLTGSEDQVRAAANAYRAFFSVNDTGDDFYLVDHSTFTYLVTPDHGFVEYFRRETTPSELAERTACFLDKM